MARRFEAWLAGSVLALVLVYWLAWAVIAPVTNRDGQAYNLARLWVIEGDGLFFNHAYTWNPQLIMPWSFDAVHYPFLRLRYGYGLPSFLCLLGILAILFAWARARGDTVDGLRACLGALAMPMLVMQATTTKNDLVLGFCLLCWIEALRRYSAQPTRASVLLAALALAFGAGCKLTGVLYAVVGIAASLWILRHRPLHMADFLAGFLVMLGLNGGLEIYLNNLLQFHDWRGDPLWYRYLANNDGWRGFLANQMRYAASLLDVQILPSDLLHRVALLKFEASQYLLQSLHLKGAGLMSRPWRLTGDDELRRQLTTLTRTEDLSTYGIVGAMAIALSPIAVIARRRLDLTAVLVLAGVAAQGLIAFTVGWHQGNHRYLVAALCLLWAGTSLLIVSPRRRWVSLGTTVLLATCALLAPFGLARNPESLALTVRDREALLSGSVRELIARAETWKREGDLPVVLTAGRAAPVFYLYDRLAPNLIAIPNVTDEALARLDDAHRRGAYRIVAIRTELKLSGITCEATLRSDTRICHWRRR